MSKSLRFSTSLEDKKIMKKNDTSDAEKYARDAHSQQDAMSYQSKDSMGSFDLKNVDMDEEQDERGRASTMQDSKGYNFTLKTGEGTFVSSMREEAAKDLDEVFIRLCPKNKYSEQKYCQICGPGFGILKMKKKKNCHFCGKAICKTCTKKKRRDPQNPNAPKFHRMCELCDDKYVNKKITDEHVAKMQRRKEKIDQKVDQINKVNDKLQEKQMISDNLRAEKTRRDNAHADKVHYLSDEVSRIKDEIKRVEAENKKFNEDNSELHKEIQLIEMKLEETRKDYEVEQQSLLEMKGKLKAIDQDLAKVNNNLIRMEKDLGKKKAEARLISSKPTPAPIPTPNPDFLAKKKENETIVVSSKLSDSTPRGRDDSISLAGSPQFLPTKRSFVANQPAKGSGSCDVCNIF
jgi:hypothetical protein